MIMCKMVECANRFVKESSWKELALVKFCLCSMGIMIGSAIPKEKKKCVFLVALTVFLVTYIPLMVKFVKTAVKAYL